MRLFTVLAWIPARHALRRIHTSHPEEYPVGGEKTMPADAPWPQQVLVRQQPYLGEHPADVAAVFSDWPVIEDPASFGYFLVVDQTTGSLYLMTIVAGAALLASVYNSWPVGLVAMLGFLALITVPFVYEWRRGGVEWG